MGRDGEELFAAQEPISLKGKSLSPPTAWYYSLNGDPAHGKAVFADPPPRGRPLGTPT